MLKRDILMEEVMLIKVTFKVAAFFVREVRLLKKKENI